MSSNWVFLSSLKVGCLPFSNQMTHICNTKNWLSSARTFMFRAESESETFQLDAILLLNSIPHCLLTYLMKSCDIFYSIFLTAQNANFPTVYTKPSHSHTPNLLYMSRTTTTKKQRKMFLLSIRTENMWCMLYIVLNFKTERKERKRHEFAHTRNPAHRLQPLILLLHYHNISIFSFHLLFFFSFTSVNLCPKFSCHSFFA